MKTGTTFLQSLMHANRDALLDAGLLVAGSQGEQVHGVRDIMHDSSNGAWDLLTERILTHPGDASVVSMEFLSFANKQQAARVVESLAGAELHVILTVRDARRAMPSQWQASCLTGGSLSWPRFARQVMREVPSGAPPRSRGARNFVRAQGVPEMLRTWSDAVPAKHLHVITTPLARTDPMLLWRRLAEVLNIDPAVCSVPPPRTNTSLGFASTDLIRRINARTQDLSKTQRARTLGRVLAPQVLRARAALEKPVGMNLQTLHFAVEQNRRVRKALKASAAHVVGDVREDLPVRLRKHDRAQATSLQNPTEEELLEAACAARDGLHALIQARGARRRAGQEHAPEALTFEQAATTPEFWARSASPLDAALDELRSLVKIYSNHGTRTARSH